MTPKDGHEQAHRLSVKCRKASRKEMSTILDAFCMATRLNRKYASGLLQEPTEKRERTVIRRGRVHGRGDWSTRDDLGGCGFPMVRAARGDAAVMVAVCAQGDAADCEDGSSARDDQCTNDRSPAGAEPHRGTTQAGRTKRERCSSTRSRFAPSVGMSMNRDGAKSTWCRTRRADGEFAYSINFPDIHSTWVETRAVLSKAPGIIGGGTGVLSCSLLLLPLQRMVSVGNWENERGPSRYSC